MSDFRFIFFGTPEIAAASLDALKARGMLPVLIVTAPDKPRGRGLVMTPSLVRLWGDAHGIPVLTPTKLSDESFVGEIAKIKADVFVVVAYGKILPEKLLSLAPRGTLNMHPSLLPKHRGPSPIESQVLIEESVEHVGVSVMLLDQEMDHGPILKQKKAVLSEWPVPASVLYDALGRTGAELLAETLPLWVSGDISPAAQDHSTATYCAKIKKEDGLLNLLDDATTNYRKFLAYDMWPRTYFMHEVGGKPSRVIITEAALEDGVFVIKKVIPEGRREMLYEQFLKNA
ncbi:MAG: methionyl-tRNA formyltransferase [Candidatus Pacebacteria bacterium]|nr:methionyl-tRNA formyltransferase [Candidatus Paceibacterota bacterium]